MMMRAIIFILIMLKLSDALKSDENPQSISLIAPSAIFSNHPYFAFLTTPQINVDTDIFLKLRRDEVFYKIRKDQDNKHDRLLEFKNAGQRGKYEKFDDGQFGYPLQLIVHQNQQCMAKEILLVYKKSDKHLFIQLDKPFYEPGDEIKFRILALNHDTKPDTINNIRVEFRDSVGMIIWQTNDLRNQKFTSHGLFEGSFSISEEPNFGTWKISTLVNNILKSEKKFIVEKIQLPLFEVVIESEDVFYFDEAIIDLTFYGKYAFGAYAKGTAILKIFNMNSGRQVFYDKYKNMTAIKNVKLNITKDLKIESMAMSSMVLNVSVGFHQDNIKSTQVKTKLIKIFWQRNHLIEVIQPYPLQDGINYDFTVVVKDLKGKMLEDSGIEPVQMTCTIIKNDNNTIKITNHKWIKNYAAHFRIDGQYDVNELRIMIEYRKANIKKIIRKDSERSTKIDVLKVFADESIIEEGYEDDISVTVHYSQGLQEVIVLAVNRFGICYGDVFQCENEKACNLHLNGISYFYDEMKPKVKIVVYSFGNHTQNILMGHTTVEFEGLSNNKLEIQVPAKTSPGSKVEVNLNSKNHSVVSVLAIDKKMTFVREGHDITSEFVVEALTGANTPFYANKEDNDIIFDKNTKVFIVSLQLNKFRTCNSMEIDLLKKINETSSAARNSNEGQWLMGRGVKPKPISSENIFKHESISVRKHFPKTWIWKTIELDGNGKVKFKEVVPDSITSWLFTAFSLSDYGFAIAKQVELISTKDFFIELNIPYSIKFGEILNLEVIAFNFLSQGDINVDLNVMTKSGNKVQQFEFIVLNNTNDACMKRPIDALFQLVNFTVPHKQAIRKDFLIRSLVTKKMSIFVEAIASSKFNDNLTQRNDKIEKELIIENEGISYFQTNNLEFKLNNETKVESQPFKPPRNVTEQSLELIIIATGNILGASLNFHENMLELPDGCGEQTLSKYSRTFWVFTYLKRNGKLSSPNKDKGEEQLNKGYQNMMKYRTDDGGFKEHKSKNSSTWLSAYAAYVLGSAMQSKVESINKDTIEKALKFCQKQQNPNGSFISVGYSKFPYPEEESESREVRFTAFVLLAFLKNENFVSQDFSTTITKAFKFIKSSSSFDNFAAAIAAYAETFNSQGNETNFLEQLEKRKETDGHTKHWNLQKGILTSVSTKVLISSYVAMAYIRRNETDKAKPIIRWLLKLRNPQGEFSDTYTTGVATEAFAMMAEKLGAGSYSEPQIHLKFESNTKIIEHVINNATALIPFIETMPKGTTNLTIKASGTGYATVTTYFQYYVAVNKTSNVFNLDVKPNLEPNDYAKIQICFEKTNVNKTDMVMIEVHLVSGYIYDGERSNPMEQYENIENVEEKQAGTVVNLYLSEVNEYKCIEIYAKQSYYIKDEKSAPVKIYEYNRKDKTFTLAFYKIHDAGC